MNGSSLVYFTLSDDGGTENGGVNQTGQQFLEISILPDDDGCDYTIDECGVCDGDNLSCLDECGIPNGNGIEEFYADWDGDGYGDCTGDVYNVCPNEAEFDDKYMR